MVEIVQVPRSQSELLTLHRHQDHIMKCQERTRFPFSAAWAESSLSARAMRTPGPTSRLLQGGSPRGEDARRPRIQTEPGQKVRVARFGHEVSTVHP